MVEWGWKKRCVDGQGPPYIHGEQSLIDEFDRLYNLNSNSGAIRLYNHTMIGRSIIG